MPKLKNFVVQNPKTKRVETIPGPTLAAALKAAGLNPAMWEQIGLAEKFEDDSSGDNQGDGRQEDN